MAAYIYANLKRAECLRKIERERKRERERGGGE